MGIGHIAQEGQTAELLRGYKDGGKFTSESLTHLSGINTIRDDQMVELAEFFGVNYRKDF